MDNTKLKDFESPAARRSFLEKTLNISLSAIDTSWIENTPNIHCENLIGATSIPLGVAGPLVVKSSKSKIQSYFVPLATTEGALVASINRGAKVVTESGGLNVFAEQVGTTRGPVFHTGSLKKSKELSDWIQENEVKIREAAESTSAHLHYKNAFVRSLADYVFVRFSFDTEDAMGMNMVTIATQAIVDVIEQEAGITCLSLAGNFDSDKKAAWLNSIERRGWSVTAEVTVPEDIVKTVLKTTPQQFFDVWLAKCMIGSAMAGSMGFNSHFANIIAAIYLATGQDAAHVVEGSLGLTTARVLSDNSLYFSVYLPCVLAGTIGGGTNLPTQQEALKILGVNGTGKIDRFIEIIGGSVLAGELSLLASLAEGSLAKSHKKLGR